MSKYLLFILTIFCGAMGNSSEINFQKLESIRKCSDIYTLDKELRAFESKQIETLLPEIQKKAQELGWQFFENFKTKPIQSMHQAWEYRYLYVPVFYKLGMTKQAADLSQQTFEYLFPKLHKAVLDKISALFGKDYLTKCDKIIALFSKQTDQVSSRVKSTHSIWKKMENLEAFEKMSSSAFAECVNDFIGIRWEMKVLTGENRYDALLSGVQLAPLKNIVTFRNQQLPQKNGFASEPVMKLCYIIDQVPVELQLLGGNITAYMCAKGYSAYKTKLVFSPQKDSLYENHRLGMALKYDNSPEFRKYMFAELLGQVPDYSKFDPFILDEAPSVEKNRELTFSESPIPIYKLPNLNFK